MNTPRMVTKFVVVLGLTALVAVSPGQAALTAGNLSGMDQALDRTAAVLHDTTAAVEESGQQIDDVRADVEQLEADWKAGAEPQEILAGLDQAARQLGEVERDLRRATRATRATRDWLVDIKKAARMVGSRVHYLEARDQITYANGLLNVIQEQKIALRAVLESIVALREKVAG